MAMSKEDETNTVIDTLEKELHDIGIFVWPQLRSI